MVYLHLEEMLQVLHTLDIHIHMFFDSPHKILLLQTDMVLLDEDYREVD